MDLSSELTKLLSPLVSPSYPKQERDFLKQGTFLCLAADSVPLSLFLFISSLKVSNVLNFKDCNPPASLNFPHDFSFFFSLFLYLFFFINQRELFLSSVRQMSNKLNSKVINPVPNIFPLEQSSSLFA